MYCVIDIGSNTIRLKTYDYKEGKLFPIFDKKKFGRLASFVDDEKNLTEQGISTCIKVLKEYKESIENINIDELYVFATASLRNIHNTTEVLERIKAETGIIVDVISGQTEAKFDFIGATSQIEFENGIMVDIGGGSVELIFVKNNTVLDKYSIPIGSLNMYVKHVSDIIPTRSEAQDIKKEVVRELDNLEVNDESWGVLCGIGGSIRASLQLKNEMIATEEDTVIKYEQIKKLYQYKNNKKSWQKNILKIVPERIFTITPGVIILKTIMKYYGCNECIVSNTGVREGYLLNQLKEDI